MSMHLFRDLENVRQELLAMGGLVEEAINKAITALVNRDETLVAAVLEGEEVIDQKEVDIAENCLKVLALHQPVASDLRFVVACMMVNNDLERMADLAANIADRARFLIGLAPISIPEDLIGMTAMARKMVKDSLDSLVNEDAALAREIIQRDEEVDETHRLMYQTVQDHIRQNPDTLDEAVHILSVSRQLERIADHATNIAEEVVFMVEGQIIRHQSDAGEMPPK